MRARDLLILASVLLIAGFAALDALRGDGTTTASTSTSGRGDGPQATVREIEVGELGGRLVFTGRACVIQELDLASGTVFPLPRIAGTCRLWAPPRTERLAYSLRSPTREVVAFRVVDLNHANVDLGRFRARAGSIAWSPDGQRVGWCDLAGNGRELEIGDLPRGLPGCPAAYTDGGEPAYASDGELRVGARLLVRVRGDIDAVSFGRNGSIALQVDGGDIQVYGRTTGHLAPAGRRPLFPRLRNRVPAFSPDNCGAFFEDPSPQGVERITVVDLGCLPGGAERSYRGRAAAWSPDGRWLAVAGRTAITFHDLTGEHPVAHFTASASDLAWKS